MNLKNKTAQVWIGLILSVIAFGLTIRRVAFAEVKAAFVQADYFMIGVAVVIQLFVLCILAGRWRQLFKDRLRWLVLFRSLLVAQLVNVVLPVRLGMVVRVYLVGRAERISRAVVFGTLVIEKMFDSLMFGMLFILVIPFVAPNWFQWSALPTSTGLFLILFPALIFAILRKDWLSKVTQNLVRYIPGEKRFSLALRVEKVFEGIGLLQGGMRIIALWGWTLFVALLGVVVNYTVMFAFNIQVPVVAAFFLLVVLQMGSRIPAPLGGIGVFQYLCVEALAFFSVNPSLALSFGFVLHFVVFVPGALLGAVSLYQIQESLPSLREAAEK